MFVVLVKQQQTASGNTLLLGRKMVITCTYYVAQMKLKLCTQTLFINIKITTKLHVCKQQQTASGNTSRLGDKYGLNYILALKLCTQTL